MLKIEGNMDKKQSGQNGEKVEGCEKKIVPRRNLTLRTIVRVVVLVIIIVVIL